MCSERVKEDMNSETAQCALWKDLQAVSSDELNKETEANTSSKSKDNEQNREETNKTEKEYKYFCYRHKKFGDVFGTI